MSAAGMPDLAARTDTCAIWRTLALSLGSLRKAATARLQEAVPTVAPLVWSHLPRTRQIYATKVHVRSTWHDCTLEEGVRVKSNIEICHELYE